MSSFIEISVQAKFLPEKKSTQGTLAIAWIKLLPKGSNINRKYVDPKCGITITESPSQVSTSCPGTLWESGYRLSESTCLHLRRCAGWPAKTGSLSASGAPSQLDAMQPGPGWETSSPQTRY